MGYGKCQAGLSNTELPSPHTVAMSTHTTCPVGLAPTRAFTLATHG